MVIFLNIPIVNICSSSPAARQLLPPARLLPPPPHIAILPAVTTASVGSASHALPPDAGGLQLPPNRGAENNQEIQIFKMFRNLET